MKPTITTKRRPARRSQPNGKSSIIPNRRTASFSPDCNNQARSLPSKQMKAGLLEGVMGRYPTVDEEKEENGKWISISKVPEEQHRIRSIIDHLMRLFNTRCDSKEKSGYTGQRLSYGLPELTEFYRKDRNSIKKLRDAIEKAVTNYEPRLTQVEVIEQNVDSPDFSVAFLLKAQIIDETAHLRALFSTDGSASVTLVSGQQ